MKVSHSMLQCWKRCRYRFYLYYVENIITPSGVGQARGTAGHHALGLWYKERYKIKTDKQYEKVAKKVLDGAWEKFQLGWLNYDVAFAGKISSHRLGPAEASTKAAQGLFVLLPDKATQLVLAKPP